MMIKFSFLNNVIDLDRNLNCLIISNDIISNKFFYSMRNEFNDCTLIIDNCKELDVKKYSIFISGIFDLDINSKKGLSLLYDEEFYSLSIDNKSKFEDINSEIVSILENIKLNSFYDLDFDIDVPPKKIFEVFNLRFSIESEDNYFNYFKNYIEIYSRLSNLKLFIAYDILSLFNEEQINELNQVLNKNNVKILDITFKNIHKNFDNSSVSIKYVDEDFCEY